MNSQYKIYIYIHVNIFNFTIIYIILRTTFQIKASAPPPSKKYRGVSVIYKSSYYACLPHVYHMLSCDLRKDMNQPET